MNPRLVLHHYPMSPFSEKVRAILGYKGLAWASVRIPEVMPKPDLVALTGGYRRTPVLQLGAHIYCDTALIAEVLERLAPQPTLFPEASAGAARIHARWADAQLFWTAIAYLFQPAAMATIFEGVPPERVKAFGADRAAFRASSPRMKVPEATHDLQVYLRELDAQLARSGDWLFPGHASIADFATYHSLWFVRRAGPLASIFDPHPHVRGWMDQIAALGHGTSERMTSEDAIALAASSPADISVGESFEDFHGFPFGTRVTVAPTDYGIDPVEGELVLATTNELALRRTDPRAGEVIVHFPRIGFQMVRAEGQGG
jgi:glutathione S-transferase